jgi:hypothetical protein
MRFDTEEQKRVVLEAIDAYRSSDESRAMAHGNEDARHERQAVLAAYVECAFAECGNPPDLVCPQCAGTDQRPERGDVRFDEWWRVRLRVECENCGGVWHRLFDFSADAPARKEAARPD